MNSSGGGGGRVVVVVGAWGRLQTSEWVADGEERAAEVHEPIKRTSEGLDRPYLITGLAWNEMGSFFACPSPVRLISRQPINVN